jgi:DNA-binding transcriptional ArsR family regulator
MKRKSTVSTKLGTFGVFEKLGVFGTERYELKKYDLSDTEKTILGYIEKTLLTDVREIEMCFRMSRTRVTYTLKKLEDRGLVSKKLMGKKHIYSVRKDAVKKYTEEISISEMFQRIRLAKHTRLYGIQSDGAIAHLLQSLKKDSLAVEKIHRVQKHAVLSSRP